VRPRRHRALLPGPSTSPLGGSGLNLRSDIPLIFGFGAVIAWRLYVYFSDRDLLSAWAKQNALELLQWHTTFLLSHPFGLGARSTSRSIYTITVRNRVGHERRGWVKIGWDSSLDVRWRDVAA
jgi:hypothetical protein